MTPKPLVIPESFVIPERRLQRHGAGHKQIPPFGRNDNA
jgi:hypothetical protein